jgi:hypothetical protein
MSRQAPRLTDYASVTDYLFALKAGGVKFGIDRMRRLSAALNHPERSYRWCISPAPMEKVPSRRWWNRSCERRVIARGCTPPRTW